MLKKYIKDNATYLEDVHNKFQFYYYIAKRYDCMDGNNKDKYFNLYIGGGRD